jgi:hypothetical protein
MSDSESQRPRELECLRLESDLTQLESATLNPDLKAHCRRSAEIWSDQAEQARKVRGRPTFRTNALLVALVVLLIVAMGGWIVLLGWLTLMLISAFV